jgi:hypothetical protein
MQLCPAPLLALLLLRLLSLVYSSFLVVVSLITVILLFTCYCSFDIFLGTGNRTLNALEYPSVLLFRIRVRLLCFGLAVCLRQAEPSPTTGFATPPLFQNSAVPKVVGGDSVEKKWRINPSTLGQEASKQVRRSHKCNIRIIAPLAHGCFLMTCLSWPYHIACCR